MLTNSSVAVGRLATATGSQSTAVGERASATSSNSVALGSATTVTASYQVGIGDRSLHLGDVALTPGTPDTGFVLYSQGGALLAKSATGAVTTLVAAP